MDFPARKVRFDTYATLKLNDIIWRAVKRAQYPFVKEPVDLSWSDGKRPDGATRIPWTRGKPLAWDITVAETYANSHVDNTDGNERGGGSRPSSFKQDSQVHRTFQDPPLHSNCIRDRWFME